MVTDLNKDNFEEFVNSHDKVVIDFWAPWCGPCRIQGPIIEKTAENNADIAFGKVNVDDNPEIAEAFQIRSIPTMFAFADNAIKDVLVGVHQENDIKAIFE